MKFFDELIRQEQRTERKESSGGKYMKSKFDLYPKPILHCECCVFVTRPSEPWKYCGNWVLIIHQETDSPRIMIFKCITISFISWFLSNLYRRILTESISLCLSHEYDSLPPHLQDSIHFHYAKLILISRWEFYPGFYTSLSFPNR